MDLQQLEISLKEQLKESYKQIEREASSVQEPHPEIEEPQEVEYSQEIEEQPTPEPEEAVDDDLEEEPQGNSSWKKLRLKEKAAREEAERQRKEKEEIEKSKIELEKRLARLEGRDEVLSKQQEEKSAKADPEPDRYYDPEAWNEWKDRRDQEEKAEYKRTLQEIQRELLMQKAKEQLNNLERQYTNNDPHYEQKINYLIEIEKKELKLSNPNASDAQINHAIEMKKLTEASNIWNSGRNPAEVFAQLAEIRGYRPPAAVAPKKKEPNVDELNRTIRKSANFIGSSSAQNTGDLAPSQLVNMNLNELLKYSPSALKKAARTAFERGI